MFFMVCARLVFYCVFLVLLCGCIKTRDMQGYSEIDSASSLAGGEMFEMNYHSVYLFNCESGGKYTTQINPKSEVHKVGLHRSDVSRKSLYLNCVFAGGDAILWSKDVDECLKNYDVLLLDNVDYIKIVEIVGYYDGSVEDGRKIYRKLVVEDIPTHQYTCCNVCCNNQSSYYNQKKKCFWYHKGEEKPFTRYEEINIQ
jgi:hypothetical protein